FGNALITDSTFDGNMSRYGGGLLLAFNTNTIIMNSTVNNNQAIDQGREESITGAGDLPFGEGGGILTQGRLIALNTTISSNQAGEAGGGVFISGGLSAGGEDLVTGSGD